MPGHILLKCPACENKLKSGMAVLGKKGECKKCGSLFRAPTKRMHRKRRLIQLSIVSALTAIFVVIPALYMRAVKNARLQSELVQRELVALDSSVRLRGLLNDEASAHVKAKLASLNPPASNTELVNAVAATIEMANANPTVEAGSGGDDAAGSASEGNIASANGSSDPERARPNRPFNGANKGVRDQKRDKSKKGFATDTSNRAPAKEKPPKTSSNDSKEPEFKKREPVVDGAALRFVSEELNEPNLFCSGEAFAVWIYAYNKAAEEAYVEAATKTTFREKDEFETTETYEALKAAWTNENEKTPEAAKQRLTKQYPPKTFVVDDLKLVDFGSYDADAGIWNQLECQFTNRASHDVRRRAWAVSDKTLQGIDTESEQRDVHRGKDIEESGEPSWLISSLGQYANLPIELERAKKFRRYLDSDSIRVALVIQFPGESRFKVPSPPRGPEQASKVKENFWDFPLALILRKVVVYEKDSGEVFFQRELEQPILDNVVSPPTSNSLKQLGW